MRLILIGLLCGAAGALAATRALSTLLFGVKPFDLPTFLATGLLLLLIGMLAIYVPAGGVEGGPHGGFARRVEQFEGLQFGRVVVTFLGSFGPPMPPLRRHLAVLAPFFLAVVALSTLHGQESQPVAKLSIAQLRKLADSGDAAAQNEMGIRYRLGNDVEKDPAKALPWFLKAAKQGYAKAYFNLGAAYYNGDGVPVNVQNSCAYFVFSADAGDERGAQALERSRQEITATEMNRCEVMAATAYLTGDLIEDDALAVKWYVSAANAGDGFASEKVAYLYDRGIGVAVDKQSSLKWLQKAVDLNFAPAIYELRLLTKGALRFRLIPPWPQSYTSRPRCSDSASFAAVGAMYAEWTWREAGSGESLGLLHRGSE